jgi:rod shape-determining protein MreC
MVAIPSRHKSLVLLIGVVLLQVLFLAIQIRRDSQGRLIRVWTVGAVTPFERAGASGLGGIRGIWNHYFALQNTTRDNERLTRENAQLKLQINELQNKADEADRLAKLLSFKQSHGSVPMLAARVIAASADSATQTLYLDRGEHDGIRRNMGVITPDGVVGKISETYPNTSQVLLLTDRDSGVGAMLVESHIQSPVGGVGEPLLAMKYVANDDTVAIGQHVVTSGMDRIFPRDLPVGTVAQIKDGNPFKQIRLKPAANLESLEDVIVLLSLQPLDLTKSEYKDPKGSANSAVESKPVADTKPVAEAKKEPQSKSKTAKP